MRDQYFEDLDIGETYESEEHHAATVAEFVAFEE